nr:DUF1761 family protein [Streptococcus suis]
MTLILGIVAGLIAFAIGGLWYGLIFRDAWIEASGIDMAKVEADRQAGKNGQKEMMISLAIEVLTAVVAISSSRPLMFHHSTQLVAWA